MCNCDKKLFNHHEVSCLWTAALIEVIEEKLESSILARIDNEVLTRRGHRVPVDHEQREPMARVPQQCLWNR